MKGTVLKSDRIGILASSLCMLHCIATPFIFLATSCSPTCSEASETWWNSLDLMFLLVSFFAIFQSSKNSSKTWIRSAMWTSWFLLLSVLLNEKFHHFSIIESAIYFPGLALIILHMYNLKYCHCNTDICCAR